MKKIIPIFSFILVSLLFVVAPSQTNVFAQNPESSTQAAQTKTVTHVEHYGLNEPIESSIPYNVAGWSGTLYLISTQSTGDRILAIYEGVVHCSGFCGMSSKLEVDEQN